MTNNKTTATDLIELILQAQLSLDDGNICQAESMLASLVGRLNETAQITAFKDKKLQEVFEYYTELNNVQDTWMKKDGAD